MIVGESYEEMIRREDYVNIIKWIILCEPITSRGKISLECLEKKYFIETKDVTWDCFFENLYVESKYEHEYHEKRDENYSISEEYTFTQEKEREFNIMKRQLRDFRNRLESDISNQSFFLIQGVAGNGKTIWITKELNRIISALNRNFNTNGECANNCLYFNMEKIKFRTIKYGGVSFYIPEGRNIIWLTIGKLTTGIMEYIQNTEKAKDIYDNYIKYIQNTNIYDKKWDSFFGSIPNFNKNNTSTIGEVFDKLTKIIEEERVDAKKKGEKEEERVLVVIITILCIVMYCSDINRKNYIVFDNIEYYIKVGGQWVQVFEDAISSLTKCIYDSANDVINQFNDIESSLGNKKFTIILVVRRTSLNMLYNRLHAPDLEAKNIIDLTGHIQVANIWAKKKKYIWEKKIKEKCLEKYPDVVNLIEFVDFVMGDGENAVGIGYQDLIGRLMSYGIRRSAVAQAHAIVDAFMMLNGNNEGTITYEDFGILKNNGKNFNNAKQYMFRRSLIESHFRWAFFNEVRPNRWAELGIGHINVSSFGTNSIIWRTIRYKGITIKEAQVSYIDRQNISLMHRVLAFLSYYPASFTLDKTKNTNALFEAVCLKDVIRSVMIHSRSSESEESVSITTESLKPLARILMSMGSMSHSVTRGAPFIILEIKDERFQEESQTVEILAGILKEIIDGKHEGDMSYDKKYRARITDAGHEFLTRWMPSYSFISALYCYGLPPLFYLKNKNMINYIIDKVYSSAYDLCQHYVREAEIFCGGDRNNFYYSENNKFLSSKKGNKVSFMEQVKDNHINHLILYKSYIQNNWEEMGFSETDTNEISHLIDKTIGKYKKWINEKEDFVCF